jgi:hypothetical protein
MKAKVRIFIGLVLLMLNTAFYGATKKLSDTIILTSPSFTNFNSAKLPLSMELNFWNIESYEGKTFLKFSKKTDSIEFYAELSNVKQKNPGGWVLGYPEVFYGFKPWLSNGISAKIWPLPCKISELQDVYFGFDYEVWYENNLPVNLAMETWVTKEKYPGMVKEGEVEIMVWLYCNILNPAGFKVDSVEIPIVINGEEKTLTWEVWFSKMNWDYIAFKPNVLNQKAKVEIPVKPFVEKAREVISKYSERVKVEDFDNMFFEVWETGTEFGDPNTTSLKMGYRFSDFNIKKRK